MKVPPETAAHFASFRFGPDISNLITSSSTFASMSKPSSAALFRLKTSTSRGGEAITAVDMPANKTAKTISRADFSISVIAVALFAWAVVIPQLHLAEFRLVHHNSDNCPAHIRQLPRCQLMSQPKDTLFAFEDGFSAEPGFEHLRLADRRLAAGRREREDILIEDDEIRFLAALKRTGVGVLL